VTSRRTIDGHAVNICTGCHQHVKKMEKEEHEDVESVKKEIKAQPYLGEFPSVGIKFTNKRPGVRKHASTSILLCWVTSNSEAKAARVGARTYLLKYVDVEGSEIDRVIRKAKREAIKAVKKHRKLDVNSGANGTKTTKKRIQDDGEESKKVSLFDLSICVYLCNVTH